MYLNTAIYALLHFLVDMVCAWSMFSFFTSGNYDNLLVYNFCAFALQMPLGTLLDLLHSKLKHGAFRFTGLGIFLTLLGALISPAILGIGNALFHVGGGFHVIREDLSKNRKGRNLGLFVAPGAIGLYLGKFLGKAGTGLLLLLIAGLCMAALLCLLYNLHEDYQVPVQYGHSTQHFPVLLLLGCFLVVIIRSWVGLAATFPWGADAPYGMLAVYGAALGKYCGGLLGARFGISKTAAASLFLASICYLSGHIPISGILGIFLFNMTMPLTLCLLASKLPHLPGFSFGLLTFGLFLGFLPVYAGLQLPVSASTMGAAGSIVTCLLLVIAGKAAEDA